MTQDGVPNTQRTAKIFFIFSPGVTLYSGIALSLAWVNAMWFVPPLYSFTELLAEEVTWAWLLHLGVTTFSMLLIPVFLRNNKHISNSQLVLIGVPVLMAVTGFLFTSGLIPMQYQAIWYLCSALMGFASAILWLCWGEYYTSIKANYPIGQVAPTVGIITLISIGITFFIPHPGNAVFVALLPLASGALLITVHNRAPQVSYPKLLPRKQRKLGLASALLVCIASGGAATTCYFTIAIIPLWDLPFGMNNTFMIGAILAAVVLIGIGMMARILPHNTSIFHIFPWLLVVVAVSILLYFSDHNIFYGASFLLASAVYGIFEVLLLMYIGILATKGYLRPCIAFGFAGGFIRCGTFVGNGIAVIFEHNAFLEHWFCTPAALFFIIVTIVMIIPVVRSEYSITSITAPVSKMSDIEMQVACVAEEFNLSMREHEVLMYLVQGLTAETIGKQLYISNFTVQTHIQHIYAKTQIHKRSELIEYVIKRTVQPEDVSEQPSKHSDTLPKYWPLPS